jgi:hypothetical protein
VREIFFRFLLREGFTRAANSLRATKIPIVAGSMGI